MSEKPDVRMPNYWKPEMPRTNPKKAAIKNAIRAAQQSRKNIISNHHTKRRANLTQRTRNLIRSKKASEEAVRRGSISRNPRSTIFNLLSIGQLNKKPSGGYTLRKQRKQRTYRK